jgi:integral membrane protein
MKNALRVMGVLEALSVVALMGIAMPMKYLMGMTEATKWPGTIHGFLFMGYLGFAYAVAERESWSTRQRWMAFLASVAPLGTLVFDWKYLKER